MGFATETKIEEALNHFMDHPGLSDGEIATLRSIFLSHKTISRTLKRVELEKVLLHKEIHRLLGEARNDSKDN